MSSRAGSLINRAEMLAQLVTKLKQAEPSELTRQEYFVQP
jgi:hypothetical protein